MFQQQVYILNTFRMMLDALSIIAGGYGARYLVSYYVPDVVWRMILPGEPRTKDPGGMTVPGVIIAPAATIKTMPQRIFYMPPIST